MSSKPEETAEVWRLLASLELLPVSVKQEIGQILIDLLPLLSFSRHTTARGPPQWPVGAAMEAPRPIGCAKGALVVMGSLSATAAVGPTAIIATSAKGGAA